MAVTAITGTAGPIWSERADAKKAATPPSDRDVEVRAQEHLGDRRVDLAGERLDGDVREREQEAGGEAEQRCPCARSAPVAPAAEDQRHADRGERGLEDQHRGHGVVGAVLPGARVARDREQREARRR